MIPKLFSKEHPYPPPPFPPFAIPAIPGLIPPGLVRPDFPPDSIQGIPSNANIETILQNHRRKMLRRAANRRSAQLSRARKKAHLEDLRAENARLQRLVDILDSQPELVFCVTPSGRITYVSERTMNFIKVTFAGEDSDDDPTHLSQILSKESVTELLEVIHKLRDYSVNRSENDLNMLFSLKMVRFQDTLGHPIVGHLRCGKVHRRLSAQDLQPPEQIEKTSLSAPPSGPPTKKQKTPKNSSQKTTDPLELLKNVSSSPTLLSSSGPPPQNWNLANFRLLADCVTSLTDENGNGHTVGQTIGNGQALKSHTNSTVSLATTTNSSNSKSEEGNSSPSPVESEDEFVCVIRTGEECFVPYRSNRDVLMFSSSLSAASIEAHDLELRSGVPVTDQPVRIASPSDSNNSNNSTEAKTTSDSSNNRVKNSTSSETGSEDNSGDLDSN